MGNARGSGLKQVNSLISRDSKSSSLNSRKFEGIRNNPITLLRLILSSLKMKTFALQFAQQRF
jgi:hypothetical protein